MAAILLLASNKYKILQTMIINKEQKLPNIWYHTFTLKRSFNTGREWRSSFLLMHFNIFNSFSTDEVWVSNCSNREIIFTITENGLRCTMNPAVADTTLKYNIEWCHKREKNHINMILYKNKANITNACITLIQRITQSTIYC